MTDHLPGELTRARVLELLAAEEYVPWDETPWVACDVPCFALREPFLLADLELAVVHWRDHERLGGCSHGR